MTQRDDQPTRITVATQAAVADFFGVDEASVKKWANATGWPCPKPGRGKPGEYDLSAIARWLLSRSGGEVDWKKKYDVERVRRMRLLRRRDEGSLIPRADVRDALSLMAANLRRAAEALARAFGEEAGEILADAVAEYERQIEDAYGDRADVS